MTQINDVPQKSAMVLTDHIKKINMIHIDFFFFFQGTDSHWLNPSTHLINLSIKN